MASDDFGVWYGEKTVDLPAKLDAALYYIGRIHTPWKQRKDCPKNARESEAVCVEFVAVALHVKEDPLAHQARLVKSDDSIAVGEEPDVVDRLQFDEWHTAAGFGVDDLDDGYWEKRFTGARRIETTVPQQQDLRQRVSATIGGNN